MNAVRFEISIPKFLMAQTLGKVSDWFLFGPLSGLGLTDLPKSELPGEKWVRLAPIASGICGSDVAMITFTSSPQFEPFASFPAVPGHEMVARVVEVGKEVEKWKEGDRVVVDPVVPCEARGFEPCPACQRGESTFCARMGDAGKFARGMLLGAHADLPGGWGNEMFAHATQLHAVPEAIDDDIAVLCEPLSVGLHAVLRTPLDGVKTALAMAGPRGRIVLLGRRAEEARPHDALGPRGHHPTLPRRETDGRHTFEKTLEHLAKGKSPASSMITHRFPVGRYQEAVSAAANRAASGAVKVLFSNKVLA